MRQLQKVETHGTYVQCSLENCKKWRFLPEYDDTAVVPENWMCSMNSNEHLNECSKGISEKIAEDSDEFIDTEYACGSMIWAKLKGYPWWPGMVDYCPDTDEYYWMDDWDKAKYSNKEHIKLTTSHTSWYHVIFFDVPRVNRSWTRAEDLAKMEDVTKPPKVYTNPKLKKRWGKASNMASECLALTCEDRIEKYSFAALFDGKWGYYPEDEDSRSKKSKKIKKQILTDTTESGSRSNSLEKNKGFLKTKSRHDWKPSQLLNLWNSPLKISVKDTPDDWTCDICHKFTPYVENLVVQHLKEHRMTLEDYIRKFEKTEGSGTLIYMLSWKQENTVAENFRTGKNCSEKSRKELKQKEHKKSRL